MLLRGDVVRWDIVLFEVAKFGFLKDATPSINVISAEIQGMQHVQKGVEQLRQFLERTTCILFSL
jgi:hypothetical protein